MFRIECGTCGSENVEVCSSIDGVHFACREQECEFEAELIPGFLVSEAKWEILNESKKQS